MAMSFLGSYVFWKLRGFHLCDSIRPKNQFFTKIPLGWKPQQMEQQEQRTPRPKHKRKSNNKSMKSETIFALMLASLHATSCSSTTLANPNKKQRKKNGSRRTNSYHHHQLQLRLLTQLRLSLLSKTHNSPPLFPNLTLPVPILSLLPLLLTSK
ncbi:hypothetical protein RHMOL_Rhmol01G0007700 [Rhododendron molle]|uniref:Uncharacterized protein n=1 Tax=Rhododendron molle TaxID=49168 RepID=A0ACC0PX88_RHOML|nr:hypothetical protein RHMOL_Rhmol01G0007700 [Rhododendron molle]